MPGVESRRSKASLGVSQVAQQDWSSKGWGAVGKLESEAGVTLCHAVQFDFILKIMRSQYRFAFVKYLVFC